MLTGNSGKGAWKGLKNIQKGRSGLRPVRSRGIRNCKGQLCTSAEQLAERWREHSEILPVHIVKHLSIPYRSTHLVHT